MPSSTILRAEQQKILEYSGGYMGVSAVPGSGKTFTLGHLAAKLVADLNETGSLDDREVLIVTMTNSAVENFQSRIASVLREESGLLPGVGYRVRTLHGLAHDIVRERPSLAGLSEDFAIVDEITSNNIVEEVVTSYLRTHPDALAPYIKPDILRSGRNIARWLTQDANDIGKAIIGRIKDRRMDFHRLRENLRTQSGTWPLLELGLEAYIDYQRSLEYRGAVDFDDLIVFSLRVLESDEAYLARLQQRWPYVLEDEAQDSSALQERLLRTLTASHGNWVRVGDANQAINTTFTSADPQYLRNFIRDHPEQKRSLPVSGRSALPIIETANRLIRWSQSEDYAASRDHSLLIPLIEPTPPGDPQPNPPTDQSSVYIWEPQSGPLSPDKEVDVIVSSLAKWLPENRERTVAVLAPTHGRIYHIADALQRAGLPVDDSLMRSGSATRQAARALAALLNYLAHPQNGKALADAWAEAWWPQKGVRLAAGDGDREESMQTTPVRSLDDAPEAVRTFAAALKQLRQPEDFLFPTQADWLEVITWMDEVEGFRALAEGFRNDMQRWTRAVILPIDELLITIGNELFNEPANLALAHHLAVLLSKLARENRDMRLPELARELQHIAENRRRMPDFSSDTVGYEPKPGVVTIATMHGAKGLEWDRVYLTAVSTFDFPGGGEEDSYRSEPFYARDRLNLVAEALVQLDHLYMGTLDEYKEGDATVQARLDYAAERLRLFYVGITRARRELIVTYNTGRKSDTDPRPASAAFQALAASA